MPDEPKKSKIAERLRTRITKRNQNALILIVGDTGSSKSLSAIRLGMEVDPSFEKELKKKGNTLTRIAHQKGSHFIKILNDSNIKRGHVIIWDDVGKGLKKRDWYDVVNKMIVDVLQTFRILGLCVIFTCPDPRLIDSNALALFHYWGEMLVIDYKEQRGVMKYFETQINRRSGKTYWHYPRVKLRGKVRVITRFKLKRPPLWIEEMYEADKAPVVAALLKRTAKTITKLEEKEKIQELTDGEILEEILKESESYMKTYNKREFIDPYAIMSGFKIGLPRANKLKGMAERNLFSRE